MTVLMEANKALAAPRRLLLRYIEEAELATREENVALGKKIREARDSKLWKQKELAATLHVEPQTVSRWERGENTPDVGTLRLLAEATGRPLSFFIERPAAEDDRLDRLESQLGQVLELVRELRDELAALREPPRVPRSRTARAK